METGDSGRRICSWTSHICCQPAQPEISDLCKAFTLKGKFLSDPKYAFKLEAYANDTPASNILREEVDIAQSALFLLTTPEFPRTEVVKCSCNRLGAQVERMKRVRIFNPLRVLGNNISVPDIKGLKILKARGGHFRHVRLGEGKLCKTTSIHLRVACSAH